MVSMQPNPPGLDLVEKNKITNTKKPIIVVIRWQFLSQVFYDTVSAFLFGVCLPDHMAFKWSG